ncbi:MAG: AsnC family transcriptional regulator, partial [Dehalococcoidales bacterium]
MPEDSIDRKLLNLIQADFPLVHEPYAELGGRLGITGEETVERIARFKQTGLVRQISPVLDGRRLGYQTTLVAMRVPESSRETAEEALRQHPGVSHGYERDHRFNIWFTLALPPEADVH